MIRHQRVVGILGCGDADLVVSKNRTVPVEFMGNEGIRELSVDDAEARRVFGCEVSESHGDEAERGIDKLPGLRRSVDLDVVVRRSGTLEEKVIGHDVGQAEIMIRVKVREEDRLDLL